VEQSTLTTGTERDLYVL